MKSRTLRFHAYLEHVEGRSVLTMSRADWHKLRVNFGKPVLIDLSRTPMADVAHDAAVVATIGERFSTSEAQILIFRYDTKDAPMPYNLDKYRVWEKLPSHRNYEQMITAASTQDTANLRTYLSDNVFIVKEPPADDHWMPELPGSVLVLVKST